MATYVYACQGCRQVIEQRQSFKDDPLTVCEECGGELRLVIQPVGIIFNRSGSDSAHHEADGHEADSASAIPEKSAGESSSPASSSTESSSGSSTPGPSTTETAPTKGASGKDAPGKDVKDTTAPTKEV